MVFELHKAKCVSASYILSFVYIFSCYCLVAIAGFVPVTLVYKIPLRTQYGETSLLWQRQKALFLQSECKVMVLYYVSCNKNVVVSS